mmetsp:Transcript_23991/g.44515  ORF Transcript_23991/g.44515 Transcript_23991/m.44515 type:complete len:492 (+) Transcript_23991:243-1718(+)
MAGQLEHVVRARTTSRLNAFELEKYEVSREISRRSVADPVLTCFDQSVCLSSPVERTVNVSRYGGLQARDFVGDTANKQGPAYSDVERPYEVNEAQFEDSVERQEDSQPNQVTKEWSPPVTLASVEKTSVFYLLPPIGPGSNQNLVVERFFNGQSWVYVRHSLPKHVNAKSIFVFGGRVYAIADSGTLWERRRTSEQNLEWFWVKETSILGECRVTGKRNPRSVFCLDDFGTLMERIGLPESNPVAPGSEEIDFNLVFHASRCDSSAVELEYPIAIADAESLQPSTLILVSVYGTLLEGQLDHRQAVIKLRSLGHPEGLPLKALPGLYIAKASGKDTRSIFLVSIDGDLVELAMYAETSSYEWVVHGRPSPDITFSCAPGPRVHARSMFLVTSFGTLMERHLLGNDWIWIEHPSPINEVTGKRLRLAQVPGVLLDQFTVVFVTTSHQLAFRTWTNFGWNWSTQGVPEVHDVPYCLPDINSKYSCMKIPSPT